MTRIRALVHNIGILNINSTNDRTKAYYVNSIDRSNYITPMAICKLLAMSFQYKW